MMGMPVYKADPWQVGARATFQRQITDADVALFALITDAIHPLYLDADYAAATRFGRPIVPAGMVAGVIAAGLAQAFPQRHGLPRRQELDFFAPLPLDATLTITVEVLATIGDDVIRCAIEACGDDMLVARGTVDLALEALPALPEDI